MVSSRACLQDSIILQVFPGRLHPGLSPRFRSGTGGQFRYGQTATFRIGRVRWLAVVGMFNLGNAVSATVRSRYYISLSVLHFTARRHLRSTAATAHGCRPPASARSGAALSLLQSTRRVWHIVLPLFLHSLRFGRSPRLALWATSLHFVPSGAPSPQRASPTYILQTSSHLLPAGRTSQPHPAVTRTCSP